MRYQEIGPRRFGLYLTSSDGKSCITSNLHVTERNQADALYNAALDGFESLLLSLAANGVELTDESISTAIESAVNAIGQNYSDEEAMIPESHLPGLATEFKDIVNLERFDNTASSDLLERIRALVQHSQSRYAIVIPDNAPTLDAGDGSATWIPAMVCIN